MARGSGGGGKRVAIWFKTVRHLDRASGLSTRDRAMTSNVLVQDIFIDLVIAGGPSLLDLGLAFQRAYFFETATADLAENNCNLFVGVPVLAADKPPRKKHFVSRKSGRSFSRARR